MKSKIFPVAFRDEFKRHYGEPTPETATELLRLGREIYVGEGCWHCHSQFIRPVSNESRRYITVTETWEYQNELQRPVMFGKRRVEPESRERGVARTFVLGVQPFIFSPR